MQPRQRKRTALALASRLAVVIFSLFIIYLGGGKSLAYSLRFTSPETALRFDPANVDAVAALAEKALLKNDQRGRATAQALASAAARRDASSAAAVATLGLIQSAAGKQDLAARHFVYAQMLSRRNLPTQLWFIDRAVAANDVPNALRHYDVALRTSALAPAILIPILKSALADPEFVGPIASVLARRPNWRDPFVRDLADSGAELQNTAALFATLRRLGTPVGDYEEVTLEQRLGDAGDYASAWNLYLGMHPNAQRIAIRDGNFRSASATASLFEWQIKSANPTGTMSATNADGARLRFEATDQSGAVVSQTLLLPPGKYQLEGTVSEYDPPARSFAEMRVICLIEKSDIARIALPMAATNSKKFSTRFVVANTCRAQQISLYVNSSGTVPLSGAVTSLTLSRTNLSTSQ